MTTELLQDEWAMIRYQAFDHRLEFEVLPVVGFDSMDPETGEFGPPLYKNRGKHDYLTSNPEEAIRLVRGDIKWDGCANVIFGDDSGYIHLCGKKNWTDVGRVMARVWELAETQIREYMPAVAG